MSRMSFQHHFNTTSVFYLVIMFNFFMCKYAHEVIMSVFALVHAAPCTMPPNTRLTLTRMSQRNVPAPPKALELFAGGELCYGPEIETGFYYDT